MTDQAANIDTATPPAGTDGGHLAMPSHADRGAFAARGNAGDPSPEAAEHIRIHGLAEPPEEFQADLDADQNAHETPHTYELPKSVASDPALQAFAGAMSEHGLSPDDMAAVVKWGEAHKAQVIQNTERLDQGHIREAAVELHQVWGNKRSENLQAVNKFLADMPDGVGDVVRSARLPNGKALGNDLEFLQWALDLAKGGQRKSGDDSLPVGQTRGKTGDVDAEIAQIEQVLFNNRRQYDKDPAMQQRYRSLLAQKHGV